MAVIAILAVAFGVWSRWGGNGDANLSVSVAVLPFANMSNDPEQQYFSDGVTEEILNHLTHLPGLQVTGRTSSFSFRGQNKDLRAIGEALGVTHLLKESVRRAAGRQPGAVDSGSRGRQSRRLPPGLYLS